MEECGDRVGKSSRQMWRANRVLCTVLPYVPLAIRMLGAVTSIETRMLGWEHPQQHRKRNTSLSDDQVVVGCGPR